MKTKIILAFALLIAFNVNAQDKLLLLNGRVDRGKIMVDNESTFDFKIYKNGGAEKIIPYAKYRIFSVTDIVGKETVLYKRDTSIGNFRSENQMRMYIYGQRDAHNNFGSAHHFIGGFLIGFTAAIFDTYEFDNPGGFFIRSPSIMPVLVPLVIPLGASLLPSKIMKDDVSDIGYLNSEEYIEGFNKVKKFKRIKNSFLGSIAGVAVGLVSYYALRD